MNKFYGTEAVWGMGIVEDVNDPERAGRLRVRIYGIHNVDMNILPTDDLPWSQVLMPVNSAGLSGVGTSPVGAKKGSMVYGQFLDGKSMQQFLVMGTMPGKRTRSEVQVNNGEAPTTEALVGNSAAEQIYNFAKTRGLSEEMAAGIVGSIAHETRLRFDPTEDNGNGVGIGRFRGQELEELKNYASARGTTFEDLATQASFIVDKLTGQIPSDKVINFLKVTEDDAFVSTSVNPITTAAEASDAFTQIFYRESTTENAAARQEYARQATSAYGSTPNDADLGPFAPRVAADVVSKGSYIESTEHLYTHFRNTQRELTRLVVHHTDTYENMDTSVEDIDDWHKQRGWSEIGYHFVIRRDGRIQVGRDIEKTGAHARAGGFNRKSVGIAFVGGKVGSSRRGGNQRSKTTFTDKQWEAFDRFLSDWHRVFPNSQILGHNDTDRTHTDPEFDVAAYVAAKFSEWRRTTPVAPAQTPGQSGVQSSTTGTGEVTVEAPVVVDPVAVPQAAEPVAEPYSVPDIDTDGILEAPAGDIVLPEIDLGNFPSIPDIFEDVTGSITDISLGDIFGDSISSGASNGNSTLGGQSASYYLDFDNFINIPSPTITLGGDVTGSGTMTELGDVTINTTLSVTGTFAPLDSPAFIGSPTAPTATAGDNTTRIATTAYVQGEIASLGGGDVSVSGTPANNQLTVWTAADTVEGDSNLTWDGATLAVTGNVEPGTDATYSLGASNKQWQDIYIDGTIYQDGVAYDLSTFGSGSGDVSKVGTPVDNQVAVWTGDGTVEGDANLTWDGSIFHTVGEGRFGSGSYIRLLNGGFPSVRSSTVGMYIGASTHVHAAYLSSNKSYNMDDISTLTWAEDGNGAHQQGSTVVWKPEDGIVAFGKGTSTITEHGIRVYGEYDGSNNDSYFSIASSGNTYQIDSVATGTESAKEYQFMFGGANKLKIRATAIEVRDTLRPSTVDSGDHDLGIDTARWRDLHVDRDIYQAGVSYDLSTLATTTYVDTAVSDLVDSAPTTLDTLNELAAALGDDPNFATTVTTSIGTKWTQDNTKISNWDTAYSWGDHSLAGYLTSFTETNDLSTAVTWANVPDANITQSSVTQHEGALSITESQISDLGSYITASSTNTLTNKSGNISQWTNDSGYLTSFTETNDLSTAVTWANVPDANITQSSVTQHQSALTIAQSQVTNLTTDLAAKAPLASPALTGTPTAPTATSGTNTTQLATTAFVQAAVTGAGGGDVSKVGTPVDNQIGVWTGDGTIEGDSDFTWNGTTLYVSNSSDTLPALSLNSASDSSDAAPILDFVRTSASPDDGDYLGQIKFKGDNSTSGEVVYAKITGKTSDVTNGTEDGLIEFMVKSNGANVIAARLTNSDFKLLNGHGITINGDLTFDGASSATVDRILDEDTMSSNSATALATQQSIKAYVDAAVPPANTTASTTSTTQTSVYTFATATYHGAELVITVNDTVAGERQIVKLVVTHDGTTAIATEYASIFTGTSALASFDVDINSGNVRLLVTSASTNNTDYVINATLL